MNYLNNYHAPHLRARLRLLLRIKIFKKLFKIEMHVKSVWFVSKKLVVKNKKSAIEERNFVFVFRFEIPGASVTGSVWIPSCFVGSSCSNWKRSKINHETISFLFKWLLSLKLIYWSTQHQYPNYLPFYWKRLFNWKSYSAPIALMWLIGFLCVSIIFLKKKKKTHPNGEGVHVWIAEGRGAVERSVRLWDHSQR